VSVQGLDRKRIAGWVALVAAALATVVIDVAPGWNAKAYDLSALVVGGQVLHEAGFEHLYDHDPRFYNQANSPAFAHAAQTLGFDDTPTPFVHAPVLAVLGAWLARFRYASLVRAWLVASTLALFGGLAAGVRHFAPRTFTSPGAWAALLFALLPFEPIRYTLWLGQTTPFVVLLVMLALRAADRRSTGWAGALLAGPAFVKLTPALFVVPWVFERRSRAVVAFAIALASLAALSVAVAGLGTNLAYVARAARIGGETLVAYNNQGVPAFLERLRQPAAEVMRWQIVPVSPATRALAAIVGLSIVLVAWWACSRLAGGVRERLAETVVVVFLLLVPSISWTHYFVLLVPPALGLWELAPPTVARSVRASLLAALALCSRPIVLDHTTLARGPVTLIVGPTLAAGIVYVVTIVVARRLRHATT
jgi:hypothetical protein